VLLEKCPNLRNYLLTPRSRVLPEKLTGFQLVKKFPAFYGTQSFITPFIPYPEPAQFSPYPHIPLPEDPLLILFSHLRLGLPSGFHPSGFPTKTLYANLTFPIRTTCPVHHIRKMHYLFEIFYSLLTVRPSIIFVNKPI